MCYKLMGKNKKHNSIFFFSFMYIIANSAYTTIVCTLTFTESLSYSFIITTSLAVSVNGSSANTSTNSIASVNQSPSRSISNGDVNMAESMVTALNSVYNR